MKRIWGAIFIVSIFLSNALPDEIIFKDGRRIEGVIKSDSGDELLIETAGGVFTFKRNTIDRIVKKSDVDNILSKARVEESKQNYVRAVELYGDAIRSADTPSEKETALSGQRNVVQKFVDSLAAHDVLLNGLDDIKTIEQIKTKVSDPSILAKLQSKKINLDNDIAQTNFNEGKKEATRRNYEKAIVHYEVVLNNYPEHPIAKELDKKITELYITQGEKVFARGSGDFVLAREAFKKALGYDENNARALFDLGMLEYEAQNYKTAQELLQKVDTTKLAGWEIKRLQSMVNRSDRELAPRPVIAQAPVQTIVRPTPTPELTRTEAFGNWFADKWSETKTFFSEVGDGSADVTGLIINWAKILGIGFGILIVGWYFPMKILINDLPKRRVVYYDWRKIVKYTGILGLGIYFVDRWFREEPSKRCPACNRALDNPILFENYEFEKCPYCSAEIKPVFTMEGLIQSQASAILMAKTYSSGTMDEAQRQQMLELINLVMVQSRKIRASDIHIEPDEQAFLIRFRVDGVITSSISIDRALQSFFVSSIKVMCNLNIAEKRLPQDGHFRRVILGEDVNVRVSTIPTNFGEKAVLRLLDQRMVKTTLDRLGMRDDSMEQYRKAVSAPHGMILATGPTGSGKTTLLYGSLQYINDGTKNIITVEDPIEYELDGINQIQHNSATGMTFATALRSILRQDPDVIMVGEIRDLETATIAVNAALTGHLVFSTLHTIDTSQTLSRLIDIGVDVKLLSSSIQCVVAQRLVRKLCAKCRKQYTASGDEIRRLGKDGKILDGQKVFRARGCRDCNNTGYLGRTGIYEILFPNREVRGMIEAGASKIELREASVRSGMKTLREEGLLKVLSGVTSIEEIIRVTSDEIFAEDEDALDEGNSVVPTD